MLNKLTAFVRRYDMIAPGDTVICALSGGADSVALLFSLYLLREKLGFTLKAAHFNHHLRGEESDRDEAFVRTLCDRYDIELYVGSAQVRPGKKGLEAAAREARYRFFDTLPGKIATAHTANDNAETVLLHLVRGTGLKGLGGIAPVNGKRIRPMLDISRQEVLDFLEEYCLSYVRDSSNDTDAFLRNRLRHHVMPLLVRENPCIARNLSAMALELREDGDYLEQEAEKQASLQVSDLMKIHRALRNRILADFLKENGVTEPESAHIALVEQLVFSEKPSAWAQLPGGVTVERCYDRLQIRREAVWEPVCLNCPGETEIPALHLKVLCRSATEIRNEADCFTISPAGALWLRPRQTGDAIRLSGGTKSLKKLFIDRKIPASRRSLVPVLADDEGVLAVCGIGVNLDRVPAGLPAVQVVIIEIE